MHEAQIRAQQLLQKVSTRFGFTAAPVAEDNYMRVWSRDATICGLAALTTTDEKLHQTFKISLQTLWQNQHKFGFLPSNVDVVTGAVSYGGTAGRADTASWAIIGLCLYARHTGDKQFALEYEQQVASAFTAMNAWEFNGKALIYVPQSADWADEYIQHGYILYDQLLRLWALKLAASFYKNDDYLQSAKAIEQTIMQNFWYRAGNQDWYAGNMIQQKEQAPHNFWWLGFNPSQIYPQFDLQANALAVLLGLSNVDQNKEVFAYAEVLLDEGLTLLPSFWPAITNADWQMEELKHNYAYRFRNLPGQFHNGGLWPVWNGLFIAAAQKAGYTTLSQKLMALLQTAVAKNNYQFNECLNAFSGEPCGVAECAWGAAGVLIAANGQQLFDL